MLMPLQGFDKRGKKRDEAFGTNPVGGVPDQEQRVLDFWPVMARTPALKIHSPSHVCLLGNGPMRNRFAKTTAMPTGCATCMTFRHRHFRLSSLIEIAGVKEGKAEVGGRKKQCVKRRSVPSDARAAHVADGFWFLCVFARQTNNVCPALARMRGKRLRKRADEEGKKAIRLLRPREEVVGLSWAHGRKSAAGQPTLLAGYTSESQRGPSPARPAL
jgi:hypothetical protein